MACFGLRGHFLAPQPEFDQPADGFRLLLPGDKPIERKVGHRTNKACRGASEQHPRQVLLCTEVLELRAHLKIQFDKRNGTSLSIFRALDSHLLANQAQVLRWRVTVCQFSFRIARQDRGGAA
jgi:hypothetical protein